MEPTITCPHCHQEALEKYNFCIHCGQQLRCLNHQCKQMLSTGESICPACGDPVKVIEKQPSPSMNHLSYSFENKDGKIKEKIEVQLSDSMINKLFE